ncbi:tyrosine-type recombinase/integrase [Flavobacterium sp. F-380]|uniref:Tyrosine-type recombinase/integrase n=1 Tax=Flavobacterium kayseriense TaxID=2764714 RepID=A0ABR7J399_9FLAO|nr:tyrosine-type recombinase/integrase [Flavobacterium kayseriense]MBC5839873.1 tyrosine-type recombinase/integrase [Flavobacterium kayseriense]MBC5847457.1 tyrosine-type recombinase/integrase [Flavobacterium kayseriense]MBU0940077.1 tyrosine-type recombinase/integrase [Bacteroidota bacterium]
MITSTVAFRDYLEKEKKYSLHTVSGYLRDIKSFADYNEIHYGESEIDKANYSQIRAWIVSLVDEGKSTVSVNRKVSSLKAFYKFLLKSKQIRLSPLMKHKALKTATILQIPFSEKEVALALSLYSRPVGFEQTRNNLIVDLFYTTGIRRAELIHLKISDIDFSGELIKVLGKRNKERLVPILPVLIERLLVYKSERALLESVVDLDYFFLSKKGVKLNESFVYRLINTYFSAVSDKVKKSPHILRHTFATHLLNNGADLNSVKELLGHASLASTQVYTHSSLSELKKVYKQSHPRSK